MSLQLLDATGVCNDADTDATLFGIEVSLDVGTGESPLLSAASVLHRRGIDVIEASLVMRSTRRFRFTATFRCDAAQARTVLRTFENRIDTLDVMLTDPSGGPLRS